MSQFNTQPAAAALGASIVLLTGNVGCTLEPTYQRPEAPVSQQWPSGPTFASPSSGPSTDGTTSRVAAADVGWREFFTDSRLQRLIELALQHNPDARIASLNIAAARAKYQIQRAELFPSVAASGFEQVEKYPPSIAGIAAAGSNQPSGNGAGTFRYFDTGIGFTSYEIVRPGDLTPRPGR